MKDLTTGNPVKQIISFTLPILLGNICQQTYNIVDMVIVGRYVSGNALAAVGTAGFLMNFMLAVLMGLTTGTSVLIAQLFGAKQEENLRRAVATSLTFLLGLVTVISAVGVVFTPQLLRLLDVPEDILPEAAAYLRIIFGGMVFSMCLNMLCANITALGDTKRPLYVIMLCSILNVGVDLLFIRVFNWGVAGAAYATVLSQVVGIVVAYSYVHKCVPLLKIRRLMVDRVLLRSILKYSLPAAVQMSLTSFASLTIMRLVNSFGAHTIAGYTAAVKIDQFATMPLSSISTGVATFVAQNMGADFEERAKRGFRFALLSMVCLALVITASLWTVGRGILSIFVDASAADSPMIIAEGTRYLTVISSFYVLFAAFFAFNGFFRGVGDAFIVMMLTISSLTMRAVCAYMLVYLAGFGVDAVAWSIPIGWGLCSLFCVFYYKRELWRGKMEVRRSAA